MLCNIYCFCVFLNRNMTIYNSVMVSVYYLRFNLLLENKNTFCFTVFCMETSKNGCH